MAAFNIGFVIFPDLTQLDFTGPLQVLSRLPQSATHIVAKSAAPVPSDCGLGLMPTHTFANCPPLDLICIPGGSEGVGRYHKRPRNYRICRPASEGCKVHHVRLHGRVCFRYGRSFEGAPSYDALGLYGSSAACRCYIPKGKGGERRKCNHRRWRDRWY